jgi:hypothetical protein
MRRVPVLSFLAFAFLAGAALAAGWVPYSPEGGRYKVDMPGTPAAQTVPLTSPGQTLIMTEAKVQGPGGVYLASWIDYPERIAMAASSDVMLDKVRDGMATGNVLRGETKLTLGRATGREFTIAEANGNVSAVRLYWARNRLYQLAVTGRAGIETQPDTRHFFESFAILRP